MKNIIKTILISIISINTYAICPFPPDIKPPNDGIIPWLGGGFDFDRERIKSGSLSERWRCYWFGAYF